MKLKKSQIFTILACGLAAILLTLVLAVGLRSDHFGFGRGGEELPRTQANAQTLDPQEEGVESLEIKWLDGPVTVGQSPDGQIHITERCAKELDEDRQMAVTVKSGKLTVCWDGQWFRRWFNVNLGWLGGWMEKELEVLLPAGLAGDLGELRVENTSGTLLVTDCTAGQVEVSTVSGRLTLQNCRGEEKVDLSSISGDVILEDGADIPALSVSTVSGGVKVQGVASGELTVSTVSGDCRYQGAAEELHMDTVSGRIEAALSNCPQEAAMDSVSGGLWLELPESAGFVVDYSSVSGDFETDFPIEKSGGGRASCGTGSAAIAMHTTSGSMEIHRG